MDPGHFERVSALFERAREMPEGELEAFMNEACGSDAALRREMESLLAAHREKSPLDGCEPGEMAGRLASDLRDDGRAPERIGRFRVVGMVGEGGMGVVYEAMQDTPARSVAVKVIQLGMNTKQVIARFEAERSALARMDHPGIAMVFDAGATEEGRPWFAMELVRGVSLVQHCDLERLGLRDRLSLFMEVCKAIQHAHQKGIIHRDIKPSNVLVTVQDDVPQPKVIDFGIAKATDTEEDGRSVFTRHGQLIGTPAYMAPEQADGAASDIDTRADIYSLGALLYELLTGSTPLDTTALRGRGMVEMIRVIREDDPQTPSTWLTGRGAEAVVVARSRGTVPGSLVTEIRGDLDWIVMKCLEKQPDDRYTSAAELASDIRRFLEDEPVLARPHDAVYRLRKFVKRHRGQVIAAFALLLVLILGMVGTTIGMLRASERAEQVQLVSEFQAEQLGAIQPEVMGQQLREAIMQEVTGGDEQEMKEMLSRVNFTNIALGALESSIFTNSIDAIDEQFATEPVVKAQLLQTLSSTMDELGMYSAALDPQERALAIRREEFGNRHPATIESMGLMAVLLLNLGEVDRAIALSREAIEASTTLHGGDDDQTMTLRSNLGTLLRRSGDLAAADQETTRVLEWRKRELGPENPLTLTTMNNLAIIAKRRGELERARRLYESVLEAKMRVVGPQHLDTAQILVSLGAFHKDMSEFEAAETYYNNALDIRRTLLGDDHSATLEVLNNLGLLMLAMGRLERAEGYLREVVDAYRRLFGDAHPDTLTVMSNFGGLMREQGRNQEAFDLWIDCLASSQTLRGENHPGTLIIHSNLASALLDLDRPDTAFVHADRAVELGQPVLGESHWYLGVFIQRRGEALERLGRWNAAGEDLIRAHQIMLETFGEDHSRTVTVVEVLVRHYERRAEAEPEGGYDERASEWRARLRPEEETSD